MKTNESNFRRFGLVGKNIGYSFSPAYFKNKFTQEGIDASYKIFDLHQIQNFPQIFLTKSIAGLNVTIPYKEDIMVFMDDLSPEAEAIGAVNTIAFKGERLVGHNTDYIGFRDSIQPLLKEHHRQALILGTGGATKAIKYALSLLEIPFKTVSRTKGNADYVYEDLNSEIITSFPIIINATPLGTAPNIEDHPPIPYDSISSEHLIYDLVYNPAQTTFLQKAKEMGATTKNGEEMLKIQAEAAWKIWNR